MVSHPLERWITIKEHIMQLAKEGRIILDLDNVLEANYVSSQIRELCTLQFRNIAPVVLFEPWLLSPNMKERSFSTAFFDRITVNMTSCSELEEEIDEEGASKENCFGETNKIVVALEAMPVRLNCGRSLVCLTRHASIRSLLCNTQKCMLRKSRASLKCQKHLSNVPLITRLSPLQTMIYY